MRQRLQITTKSFSVVCILRFYGYLPSTKHRAFRKFFAALRQLTMYGGKSVAKPLALDSAVISKIFP